VAVSLGPALVWWFSWGLPDRDLAGGRVGRRRYVPHVAMSDPSAPAGCILALRYGPLLPMNFLWVTFGRLRLWCTYGRFALSWRWFVCDRVRDSGAVVRIHRSGLTICAFDRLLIGLIVLCRYVRR